MKEQEVLTLLKLNKSNFPYAYREMNKEEAEALLKSWYGCLKEYPADLILSCFGQALTYCKNPVTIADIFTVLRKAQKAQEPDVEELWRKMVLAGCRCYRLAGANNDNFYYNGRSDKYKGMTQGRELEIDCQKEYESLPAPCKAFIRSMYQLIDLGNTDKDERGYYFHRFNQFMQRYNEKEEIINSNSNLIDKARQLALQEGNNG